jgi:hypothetical protein
MMVQRTGASRFSQGTKSTLIAAWHPFADLSPSPKEGAVAANIYVYCPSGIPGLSRCDLEEELEAFFGNAAEDCGAGSGNAGFNLDCELAEGEDANVWADRLKEFLQRIGVRIGTVFEVFPDGWEPGIARRRVEVFGTDRWLTEREP